MIYAVMLLMFLGMLVNAVHFDAQRPNEALLGRSQYIAKQGDVVRDAVDAAALPALPVDSAGWGNLEGKELRFGPGAAQIFATATTAIACGSVDCAHDSFNSVAGLTPLTGMWLNCVFGGKGVGLVNLLVYLIIGVFLSGLMVGRTPEYLGKKVEAREMKLAMLALLVHPILVLGPTGLFSALDWGTKATSNPGAHGFSQILYEFTSSSANNGSGFEGLNDTWGFRDNPDPPPYSPHWDIATGLVMLLGRLMPMIAPIALAASMARKKRVPFTTGTLRTDTITFGCILLGTILLVGALLFMPAAVLGPVAEHLGPIPFPSAR
jgi:K+-transporting ATPase ATPase A chain